MSTVNGLPAHVLLVHGVVVLVPLTALLLVLSALAPAVRRRLVWLVAALAVVGVVLTPITADAGETLAERFPAPGEALRTHIDLGRTTVYFAVALLVVALLLVAAHLVELRGGSIGRAPAALLAILALVAGIAAGVQCYRVGDSGARAVWGVEAASSL
ncbi:DUF2231 domain-containing protein [Nocardia sp. NPDC050793]|uniref:DUF2231 domain-containing protein n=1 Tax=Nocardia sp. NPDC050793 TaxID=3155159 RepID=UPI003407BA76